MSASEVAALESAMGTTGTTSGNTTDVVDSTNSFNLDGTYDFRGGDSNVSGGSDSAFDTSGSNSVGSGVGGSSTGDFTTATDLGNGLYSVDNGDGTYSIVTEDGVSMGSVGGGLESVQDWEGNLNPSIGVPNVVAETPQDSAIYYYPDTPEQEQRVNDLLNSSGSTITTPPAGDTNTSAVIDSIGDIGRYDFGGFDNGYNAFAGGDFGGGVGGGGGGRYFDDFSSVMAVARGGLLQPRTINGLSDLGSYSDGGRLLRGPGDGVSDSIPAVIGNKQPARLADGEFVIPARIVSELGNGSTEAGARKLYAMMDRIQATRKHSIGKGKVAKNTRADKHLPA